MYTVYYRTIWINCIFSYQTLPGLAQLSDKPPSFLDSGGHDLIFSADIPRWQCDSACSPAIHQPPLGPPADPPARTTALPPRRPPPPQAPLQAPRPPAPPLQGAPSRLGPGRPGPNPSQHLESPGWSMTFMDIYGGSLKRSSRSSRWFWLAESAPHAGSNRLGFTHVHLQVSCQSPVP